MLLVIKCQHACQLLTADIIIYVTKFRQHRMQAYRKEGRVDSQKLLVFPLQSHDVLLPFLPLLIPGPCLEQLLIKIPD